MAFSIHRDPELFRDAVLYTAGQTGLSAILIEKDYYCSVLLDYLFRQEDTPLVFKGGTCLSKIYADFHRLSEDLDFTLPTPFEASRSVRRQRIERVKEEIEGLEREIPEFILKQNLTGHNISRQYIAYVTYTSAVEAGAEAARIKIEVGLREELVLDPVRVSAQTLLVNPFTERPVANELFLTALALEEAYAEKLRAALTRREPAIRDYYDLHYAVNNLDLNLNGRQLADLVLKKLSLADNAPIDVSPTRKEALLLQMETQLKAVLRPEDYRKFHLDGIFEQIAELGIGIQREEETL